MGFDIGKVLQSLQSQQPTGLGHEDLIVSAPPWERQQGPPAPPPRFLGAVGDSDPDDDVEGEEFAPFPEGGVAFPEAPAETSTDFAEYATAAKGLGIGIEAIAGIVSAIQSAKAADAQGAAIKEQAKYNEARLREKGRHLTGQQRARYGASGVEMSEGSPIAVALATEHQIDLEARSIVRAGEMQARVAEIEAKNARLGALVSTGKAAGKFGTLLTRQEARKRKQKSPGTVKKFGASYA